MIPKFRAWLKGDKEMVDVDEIAFRTNWIRVFYELNYYWFKFDDVILMQSTGLEDDSGKELFVDDVILWTYWDEFEDSGRAKIIFDKGMFKLLDIRTGKDVWDNLFDCLENCNVYLQGNVHENPELAEGIQ
jgi:uncharacterized phage protein (TIGR01671 family)